MKCERCKREVETVEVIAVFPPRRFCRICCGDLGYPFENDAPKHASDD